MRSVTDSDIVLPGRDTEPYELKNRLTALRAVDSIVRQLRPSKPPRPARTAPPRQPARAPEDLREMNLARFMNCVVAYQCLYDVTVEELRSTRRMPYIVRAREEIAWRLRQGPRPLSYPEIAACFDRRSHATFIAAVSRFQKRIDAGEFPEGLGGEA